MNDSDILAWSYNQIYVLKLKLMHSNYFSRSENGDWLTAGAYFVCSFRRAIIYNIRSGPNYVKCGEIFRFRKGSETLR